MFLHDKCLFKKQNYSVFGFVIHTCCFHVEILTVCANIGSSVWRSTDIERLITNLYTRYYDPWSNLIWVLGKMSALQWIHIHKTANVVHDQSLFCVTYLMIFLIKSQPYTPPFPSYRVPLTTSKLPSFCFLKFWKLYVSLSAKVVMIYTMQITSHTWEIYLCGLTIFTLYMFQEQLLVRHFFFSTYLELCI